MKRKTINIQSYCFKQKTSKEILEDWGERFIFYPKQYWGYILEKYWWGKKIMYIEFDDDYKVISYFSKSVYGCI